jgi:hypothetical protein
MPAGPALIPAYTANSAGNALSGNFAAKKPGSGVRKCRRKNNNNDVSGKIIRGRARELRANLVFALNL